MTDDIPSRSFFVLLFSPCCHATTAEQTHTVHVFDLRLLSPASRSTLKSLFAAELCSVGINVHGYIGKTWGFALHRMDRLSYHDKGWHLPPGCLSIP